MNAQATVAQPVSKFAFCDLALESALQLERAKAGRNWEPKPLRDLADVLSRTSHPAHQPAPAAFIESSYYQPFERLLRSQAVDESQSVDRIRDYFSGAANKLREIQPGSPPESLSELVNFCVGLHRELIRELKMEDGFVVNEWRASDIPA